MPERELDLLIVGSGAGGGAAAKELAPLCRERGARIAVAEWGPKLREEEFTGREFEMANKLYFDGGGVLTRDKSMTLAFARAYGGSTVVYTGTSLVIRKETVRRWDVPGIEWEDLDLRSRKYLSENNVHLLPAEDVNDNNRLFREGCTKLGYHVEQFPVNVKGCRGAGMCNLGCPNSAKQGTHRVQLPAAEALGVETVTHCRVDRLEPAPAGGAGGAGSAGVPGAAGWLAYATVADGKVGHPSAWPPGEYRIKARRVVVAAGAVNSPALLLRSGLGARLPALGRYFTAHPALILVAQHAQPITNYHGHPKSYYSDEFAESQKFLLETCMYFPFVTAKNLAGFGAEHAELVAHMDTLQMILVLAIDPARAGNRVLLDRAGNAIVDYRLHDDVLDSLYESMKVCARIFFAAGARRVHAPASRKFLIEHGEQDRLDELVQRGELKTGKVSITSAHLMGGCRMGAGPADAVTDPWGRVHGCSGLYVADASLFPRAAEINPYITIMALADRVAERVRGDIAGAAPAANR
ncbi:MAG: GMC family oxidoreductase [Planctomycetes bacterium]|nr:GMC family oxidoreductase [Planctomycetota bacterium]